MTLVIFEGGRIESELEELMRQVRKAIVIDQIVKAQAGGFEQIIVVTSYKDLAEAAARFAVQVDYQPQVTEEFHFGEQLLKIITQRKIAKALYMGGAAAPLISAQELRYIRTLLENHNHVVTANNYFSADLVGFAPASALAAASLPRIDNTLPQLLVGEANLKFIPLQRSLGLHFDLDTPADLLVLANHPGVGPHTKQAIIEADPDLKQCRAIKQVMQDYQADLVVYGRVNSSLFQLLDQVTHCRIRLYSEERGLKALGRDMRGEARSLLGEMITAYGYERFFNFLSQICRGAVIDSRILFAHWQWDLTQTDRFYSDLGMIDRITHPGLREFTAAAHGASIPVMLGGHSLVTGGLWALLDASYIERQNAAPV
ncbi:MAG: hypothetical protein QM399_04440 [Bacillota bacterium]|nr:hypothetical protein [Bacillota bacterium]